MRKNTDTDSSSHEQRETEENLHVSGHRRHHQEPSIAATANQLERSEIHLLRRWQRRSRTLGKRDRIRGLPGAIAELDRLSVALNLPEEVRNLSSKLIRKAWKIGLIRGNSATCMVGAVVYAACRINEIPRKISKVATEVGVSKKELSRSYRKLALGVNLRIPLPDPIIILSRIAQRAEVPQEIQIRATKILKIAKKKGLYAGRDPWGLAAAAIYLAALYSEFRIGQIFLANAAGVTEVTVRNRYKELMDVMGTEFSFDG